MMQTKSLPESPVRFKTDHAFNSWVGKPEMAGTAETIANGLAPSAWMRLSAETERRARSCMAGPIVSWPTSMVPTTTRPVCGRGGC